MITKTNKIKCDHCGQFIGTKQTPMLTYMPDSLKTFETHGQVCKKCWIKEFNENRKKNY